MTNGTQTLPVEVELALDVMPCQAMRRSYDGAPTPHPCAHFAEWGVLHSYDYASAGPPQEPGIEQPSVYAGKRAVVPEILSGCRKAPILAVGINPNLPGWGARDRNAIHPYFQDYLQYAHYFRWRATDKLRIPMDIYQAKLAGRTDGPNIGDPLVPKGETLPLERMPVLMYQQYQTLLDGLAARQGWANHRLAVGEDLAYANMVACGGARWTVRNRPGEEDMPLMGPQRAAGIVDECFNKRLHFPRQLLQSLPAVVIVFSQTTADAFIARLGRHFTKGNPVVGEKLDDLLKREHRIKLGTTSNGNAIDARVIFSPHASSNPADFADARDRIIAHISDEVDAGRLALNPGTGRLARTRGGCLFCENALYSIGACTYKAELRPLDGNRIDTMAADSDAPAIDAARERAEHMRLLEEFMQPPAPAMIPAAADGFETLDDAGPSAPPLRVHGTIATMKAGEPPIQNGALYLRAGKIVAVGLASEPPPAGFEAIEPIETHGVIVPGLSDLHNHLAYNALSLWWPRQARTNRAQWLRDTDYKSKVGMVMDVVAKRQDLLKALIRYVSVKLLMGGVTAGQGMNTKYGGKPLFHGAIRNFEQPDDAALTPIRHKITDLKSTEIVQFREALATGARMFFHLAEGTDTAAERQFGMLVDNGLLKANVVGIHSLGLTDQDMVKLQAAGASVVWSPFSNSLLYGRTIDPKLLQSSGVPFSLGSDWTPSGSRNLLCEMKIAYLTAAAGGAPLSAERLTRAVTIDAMRIAGWDAQLGSLEIGKYADITVVADRGGDPYESVLAATEADVKLVCIAGHPRYGDAALVAQATNGTSAALERIMVGGREKALNLHHPSSPLNALTLADATKALAAAFADLPQARAAAAFQPLDDGPQIEVELELDELEDDIASDDGEFAALADAVLPQSVPLDPLTVIDDPSFWTMLDSIPHLPEFLKHADGLKAFYQQ